MERPGASPQAGASFLSVSVLLHVGFVLTGSVATLLGPLLPELSARWSLDDAQAGYLFTSQFLGSMAGVALSSALLPRQGFRFSLVLGFATMSGGVAALTLSSWATGLVCVFCYGIGLGLTIPASNLWVADAKSDRRAAALNILNMAWGIGAVAWPPVVALAQRSSSRLVLLLGLATALGLMSVCLAWGSFADCVGRSRQADDLFQPQARVWGSRFLPILGALFFLYVGTENALGGWVASYARRMGAIPGTTWVLTPSFFWGALLVGRGLAPALLRYVAETTLVPLGLLLAVFGVSFLLAATTLAGVVVGVSFAGLGLASVFPIAVALLSQSFGASASRVAGAMFALGGLGGATLPWLVGFSSTHLGSLKAGLVVPLLGSLAMIALHVLYVHFKTKDFLQLG